MKLIGKVVDIGGIFHRGYDVVCNAVDSDVVVTVVGTGWGRVSCH